MIISLVVAASTNNAIGKHNQLLWHLPNDMKFFKNTTWAMPVIMGRKTFESMGNKPLNGRLNIVITRQNDWNAAGTVKANSLKNAIDLAAKQDYQECFVIGGGEIFRESMALADRIYLTRVDADLDGDVFFPEIDSSVFRLEDKQDFEADAKHAYSYHFQRWQRNKV
ncbi:MAG: dihydrofolate reductase [Chitinophagaceae bacterium]|nr:dihydrofolate reductase [Chitinophagaceae bacterium]